MLPYQLEINDKLVGPNTGGKDLPVNRIYCLVRTGPSERIAQPFQVINWQCCETVNTDVYFSTEHITPTWIIKGPIPDLQGVPPYSLVDMIG